MIKGKDVFIVDAVRTPVGKYGGSLKDSRVDDLAAHVIKEITSRNLDKNSIDKELIEDVIIGCSNQAVPSRLPVTAWQTGSTWT